MNGQAITYTSQSNELMCYCIQPPTNSCFPVQPPGNQCSHNNDHTVCVCVCVCVCVLTSAHQIRPLPATRLDPILGWSVDILSQHDHFGTATKSSDWQCLIAFQSQPSQWHHCPCIWPLYTNITRGTSDIYTCSSHYLVWTTYKQKLCCVLLSRSLLYVSYVWLCVFLIH